MNPSNSLRALTVPATALLLLTAVGCVGGAQQDGDGTVDARPDLGAGELTDEDGIRFTTPAPGMGVFAEVIGIDGTMHTSNFETELDGTVFEHLAPPADAAAASSTPACTDSTYHLAGYRWNKTLHWQFKASTTPSYLSRTAVETALRAGTATITRSRNDCGLADQVSAVHHYDGRTTVGPNILSNGTCGTPDGKSVVAFGALPDGYLAIACTWYVQGEAIEADIRFNRGDYHWYTSKPSGCSNRFDIRSVMTHERGHSFGLGHVSESAHPSLTMSEALGPCNNTARTLGLGDVRALRALY